MKDNKEIFRVLNTLKDIQILLNEVVEKLKEVYKKNFELSEALSALQGELFDEHTVSTIIQPESTCCDCDTYVMDESGNVTRLMEPKA